MEHQISVESLIKRIVIGPRSHQDVARVKELLISKELGQLADEIRTGESANIEFKVEVPKKSERYIKSVVAFANTAGGKIIIGVNDESQEIIGVDKNEVFKIIDGITNTISDMCYPQIFPNIGINTIKD